MNRTVVAIGVFDGVHLGHRALLHDAISEAHSAGMNCVVVTFDPDPADVLEAPQALSHLLHVQDRIDLMQKLGADEVLCLPFTQEFAQMPWQEFAEQILCARLNPCSVHIGENFHFGYRGEGTAALLRIWGLQRSIRVVSHQLFEWKGEVVSSTRIRGLLRQGKVEDASELLNRKHYIRGTISHGRGEGTGMGFATANVVTDPLDCMPAEGVYAGWLVDGNSAWPAAINVGAPPTFDTQERPSFLEAHMLGFEGNIYNHDVAVVFHAWLREARKFDTVSELERVVGDNIQWVRTHLGSQPIDAQAILSC